MRSKWYVVLGLWIVIAIAIGCSGGGGDGGGGGGTPVDPAETFYEDLAVAPIELGILQYQAEAAAKDMTWRIDPLDNSLWVPDDTDQYHLIQGWRYKPGADLRVDTDNDWYAGNLYTDAGTGWTYADMTFTNAGVVVECILSNDDPVEYIVTHVLGQTTGVMSHMEGNDTYIQTFPALPWMAVPDEVVPE